MPRKKKKIPEEVKLRCPTCNQHFKQVNDYHRHLKSKRHIREVTVNQSKSKKVNRALSHGLSRAASITVPKLCLKCVSMKTSENLSKYCKIGKEQSIKSWLDQKIEEVYFKTDCSVPEKKITKSKVYIYYCRVCNVPLSSLKASKDHYSREMHLKNLLKMIKSQLSCDLCGSTTVLFNVEEKVSMREYKTKIKYENFSGITSVEPVPFKVETFVTDFKTEYIETDIATENEKAESSVKTERFSDRVSSDELFKTQDTQKIEYTDIDFKTNCLELDFKTVKVDTDMKKEFFVEDIKTDIKIGSLVKIDLKEECIKNGTKIEYIEKNLKMECFETDIKTEHIETYIKTELISADIKMECLDADVKAENVECFDEEVKTNMENECIGEAVKVESFKKDVKTEYIEKDIKTEADEIPAVKVSLYQCIVCNVRFCSPKVFKAHYVDDAHVKKLLGMIKNEESFYCGFCDYSTTNDTAFKKHLDDQLHIYELKLKKPKRKK